ncbi:MAG: hypothetical protein RIQ59_712 [Bacteroidota bacterium]|jgi:uncharacterized protein (TIGR02646 family)
MENNNILSPEDYDLITEAIKDGGKVWENLKIIPLKNKVKEFLRDLQSETCCYCKKNTRGEFKMVLDIEHILPKKHYPNLIFAITNLAIACKKCNMLVKKDDLKFIVDLASIEDNPFDTDQYKFIHPNLDNYHSFLKRVAIELDDIKIVKYVVVDNKPKGQYTYDYFRLKEFEQNDLNKLQEINETAIDYTNINDETARQIWELLSLKA